jgi:tRNA (guanine37-N1)-methyltransferase
MFVGPLTESLLQKARDKKILDIQFHNLRSFTSDKHHKVDDRPFGGGPGMVMKLEPINGALKKIGVLKGRRRGKPSAKKPLVIFFSPQGETLNQAIVRELAEYQHLVLLCGHYEGIDERALAWVDREISIGDYVLTGGELPAMVLIDSIARFVPGVVKESRSVEQDSFFNGLLDYPHYTRPEVFNKLSVPKVLLSGHHVQIEQWRKQQALLKTWQRRPDLLKKASLSSEEKKILAQIQKNPKHTK